MPRRGPPFDSPRPWHDRAFGSPAAAKGEPDHAHFDVRYLLRTATPESAVADALESNGLAWVTLDRAAELMRGPESLRVFRKIARLRRERSVT